jgi:hypothetical protein
MGLVQFYDAHLSIISLLPFPFSIIHVFPQLLYIIQVTLYLLSIIQVLLYLFSIHYETGDDRAICIAQEQWINII